MSATALAPFLNAMSTRLRGDPVFVQLVGGRLYDEVPSGGATYPHAIVDDPFETPDRTFAQGGHQCTAVLSIYTQSPATTKAGVGKAGWAPGILIADRAIELLTDIQNNPLSVDGHDVVDVDVISIDCSRETDGKTRRVDVTLTATLEDALT